MAGEHLELGRRERVRGSQPQQVHAPVEGVRVAVDLLGQGEAVPVVRGEHHVGAAEGVEAEQVHDFDLREPVQGGRGVGPLPPAARVLHRERRRTHQRPAPLLVVEQARETAPGAGPPELPRALPRLLPPLRVDGRARLPRAGADQGGGPLHPETHPVRGIPRPRERRHQRRRCSGGVVRRWALGRVGIGTFACR